MVTYNHITSGTTGEVAEMLGLTESQVVNYCEEHNVPLGSGMYLTPSVIREIAEANDIKLLLEENMLREKPAANKEPTLVQRTLF